MIFKKIKNLIESLDVTIISTERRSTLQPLVEYIQAKISSQQELRLNFICTHNSRRSLLSQVWAQAIASHFELKNVFCYSGGTAATALFPTVASTLEKSGFNVMVISEGINPVYSIKYDKNSHPIIGFSKAYDDNFNPQSEFAAIMTCSHADAGCPFIAGAEKRISITFVDPKEYDGTAQQEAKYQECSLQIATELFYVFSRIN